VHIRARSKDILLSEEVGGRKGRVLTRPYVRSPRGEASRREMPKFTIKRIKSLI
jgi:hypothetical protein